LLPFNYGEILNFSIFVKGIQLYDLKKKCIDKTKVIGAMGKLDYVMD